MERVSVAFIDSTIQYLLCLCYVRLFLNTRKEQEHRLWTLSNIKKCHRSAKDAGGSATCSTYYWHPWQRFCSRSCFSHFHFILVLPAYYWYTYSLCYGWSINGDSELLF